MQLSQILNHLPECDGWLKYHIGHFDGNLNHAVMVVEHPYKGYVLVYTEQGRYKLDPCKSGHGTIWRSTTGPKMRFNRKNLTLTYWW